MSMTLYGSLPSPYVRRIRMLLEGVDYHFEPVELYQDDTRAAFAQVSPIRKLPVLVDGEQTVLDSHVICDYVRRKQGLDPLSIDELNLVSAVDAVNDSLIVVFMGQRSGLEVSSDLLMFKLQLERIPDSLAWLNEQAKKGAFKDWGMATISLISLLDWSEFRNLYDFSAYPALLAARDAHRGRAIVGETFPQ